MFSFSWRFEVLGLVEGDVLIELLPPQTWQQLTAKTTETEQLVANAYATASLSTTQKCIST